MFFIKSTIIVPQAFSLKADLLLLKDLYLKKEALLLRE